MIYCSNYNYDRILRKYLIEIEEHAEQKYCLSMVKNMIGSKHWPNKLLLFSTIILLQLITFCFYLTITCLTPLKLQICLNLTTLSLNMVTFEKMLINFHQIIGYFNHIMVPFNLNMVTLKHLHCNNSTIVRGLNIFVICMCLFIFCKLSLHDIRVFI